VKWCAIAGSLRDTVLEALRGLLQGLAFAPSYFFADYLSSSLSVQKISDYTGDIPVSKYRYTYIDTRYWFREEAWNFLFRRATVSFSRR
jgi:hypothetical protein